MPVLYSAPNACLPVFVVKLVLISVFKPTCVLQAHPELLLLLLLPLLLDVMQLQLLLLQAHLVLPRRLRLLLLLATVSDAALLLPV